MPRPATDLTGRVFGRLRVVQRHGSRHGRVTWVCACACGKERIVAASSLVDGNTRSCGCLHSELSAERTRKRAAEAQARRRRERELAMMFVKPPDQAPDDRPRGRPLRCKKEAALALAGAFGLTRHPIVGAVRARKAEE